MKKDAGKNKPAQNPPIDPNRARIKNILISAGFIITAIICYYLSHVIAPFLISLVLAYVLNPLVRILVDRKFPRPWAVLTVFTCGILIFTLFIVPFTISMFSEAGEMFNKLANLDVNRITDNLKEAGTSLYEKTASVPYLNEYLNDYLKEFINGDKIRELAANGVVVVKDGIVSGFKRLMGFVATAFSGMVNMVLIPILVFYILLDMDEIFNSFKMLLPPDFRERTLDTFAKIDAQLNSLLRGQLLANTIFAVLMTIGLWISGIGFFLFLGPLSGVANFIPYLGGLFTVILALFIAIAQYGFTSALVSVLIKVTIAIAIVQTIDGWYLQPNVVGEKAGLHPLVVMLSLAIAASLAGIPGMLLAVPVAVILKVLGKELYHELYEKA
ncbi:MAG: AI-2E family transporter [Candidatus Rifleibacteriota bacterium]